jgi:hypothetical protein
MKTLRALLGGGPFPVRRVGRRLLWRHPRVYRWFGILRNRGDCLENGFDVWFGGYPRSANTYCVAAFKLANPAVPIASHWHIPAFIIHALDLGKPGIFLIRRPVDPVISWTIFFQGQLTLQDSLQYYIDFHRAMLPYREKLFISPFDLTISHFQKVLQAFNLRFGTNYTSPTLSQKTSDDCLARVEDWLRAPDGSINELIVSRPSPKRAAIKASMLETLRESPSLSRKLKMADTLFEEFTGGLKPIFETRIASSTHTGLEPTPLG